MSSHKSRLTPYIASWAALMLVAQLVLTAGHIHLHALHSGSGSLVAASALPSAPEIPAQDDDAHCPLCWAQLASSTLVPPDTGFPLPQHPPALGPAEIANHLATGQGPRAFQPRAPPSNASDWQPRA
jgi:hypothetical protein